MDKKNTMLLTVIAVATLLVAVVGATFAYFTVSNSTAGATTVTGSVGGDSIGTITLAGGQPLYLEVSAAEMAVGLANTDYYTVTTQASRNATELTDASRSIYTATLADENGTGTYTCTYEFSVTATGEMLNVDNAGDVELVIEDSVNGTTRRALNAETLTNPITGTWSGITGNGASRTLSAYVVLHNTDNTAGQNSLAGTDLTVTITPVEFVCSPVDAQ